MKKTTPKHKYSTLERISIAINVGICIFAISILCWLIIVTHEINTDITYNKEEVIATTEAQVLTLEEKEEEILPSVVTYVHLKEKPRKVKVEELQTTEPENIPVIENVEDSISEWCMSQESKETLTLWKLTDKEGNFYVALKNDKNEFIVTFKYDEAEVQKYEDWTLCNDFFEVITTRDISDYAFTAYREVSGNNPKNVQAQVMVLINRQKSKLFPDTIRDVITERGQYVCAKSVVNRRLKSNNSLEREDLEKCFRQVLLVLAGKNIQEVPTNVVFAATGPQGNGTWKVIDGTYYCYI